MFPCECQGVRSAYRTDTQNPLLGTVLPNSFSLFLGREARKSPVCGNIPMELAFLFKQERYWDDFAETDKALGFWPGLEAALLM